MWGVSAEKTTGELVFIKNKPESRWEKVGEDFDPRKVGFKFNEELSIFNLIRQLIREFANSCPMPMQPELFIAGILIDPFGYWHLREELKRKQKRLATPWHRVYDNFVEGQKIFGFPVLLAPIDGIAIAMTHHLAPALLRQQLMQEEERKLLQMTEEPPMPEKKEDMH